VSADAFRIRLTSDYIPIRNAVKQSPQITSFAGYDVASDPGFHALGSTLQGKELVVRFNRQHIINFARANGIGKTGVETVPVEVELQFQNGSSGHGSDMTLVFVPA
jgi:hypothetical protein